MDELYAAFLSGLVDQARAGFETERQLTEALLVERVHAARAAWPDFAVTPAELARELARRLGALATPHSLRSRHVTDLYLAIACCQDRSKHAAIRAFETTVLHHAVTVSVRRTGANQTQASDVTDRLRMLLWVDDPPRQAACKNYYGETKLKHYVAIIATRELVRLIKRAHKHDQLPTTVFASLSSSTIVPELRILRDRYRGDIEACFREAFAELDGQARALLQYKFMRQWPIARIAKAFDVSAATVHRWLERASKELGDQLRTKIAARLQIPKSEVDSLVRLMQSSIEIPDPADAKPVSV